MSKTNSSLVQFVKFGIVGVANTGVDWIAFYVLINTLLPKAETTAKALAFLVAMLNSYLWNTIWTFKSEYKKSTLGADSAAMKRTIFLKFMAVSLVGWGINVFVFDTSVKKLLFELLNNKELLPLVLASGAAILWNFFANKLWTYKK